MLPYETLQTVVKVAYGPEYVPSVGHLSALVNHTGTIAGLILTDERVTSAFQAAACDEIFFHQQPILTVVEPETMAIGAIEKMGNRTANSWQAVLSHFPKLRYVISDLARGLIKGVQLSGHLLHQGDLFHFFRDVGRTTQQLERHLQRLLKEETDAWDKWCAGRIYTPTLENVLYHLQFGMSLFSCSMLVRNVPTPRVNQFSPKNLRTRETDCQNGWSTPTISDSIASRVCQTALEVERWTWSHSFSIGFSSGQYGGNGRIRICSGSGCREGSG